jgi:hypothetical protein
MTSDSMAEPRCCVFLDLQLNFSNIQQILLLELSLFSTTLANKWSGKFITLELFA